MVVYVGLEVYISVYHLYNEVEQLCGFHLREKSDSMGALEPRVLR